MQLSKTSLLTTTLVVLLFAGVSIGWAGVQPIKRPSDYGVTGGQVELDKPDFTPVSVDGVSLQLNSVFCAVNDCGGDPTASNLAYFFAINLAPGAQLDSLTFGPGFDEISLGLSGPVVFDDSLDSNDNTFCASGGTYTCLVPLSTAGLSFPDTITNTITCAGSQCTMNFVNFNYSTINPTGIPNATIIFGATSSFVDLSLNKAGVPQTPIVEVNRTVVSVPEPSSLWFSGIVMLACVVIMSRRRQILFRLLA